MTLASPAVQCSYILFFNGKENHMSLEHPAMVWVKDDAGNRWICPVDALRDPNHVSEEEKAGCLFNAADIKNPPGDQKIKFDESASPT